MSDRQAESARDAAASQRDVPSVHTAQHSTRSLHNPVGAPAPTTDLDLCWHAPIVSYPVEMPPLRKRMWLRADNLMDKPQKCGQVDEDDEDVCVCVCVCVCLSVCLSVSVCVHVSGCGGFFLGGGQVVGQAAQASARDCMSQSFTTDHDEAGESVLRYRKHPQ